MACDQYLIMFRSYAWWVMMDGLRTGPHPSELIALHAAVHTAKIQERSGHLAEVFLEGTAIGTPALYKSPIDCVARNAEASASSEEVAIYKP